MSVRSGCQTTCLRATSDHLQGKSVLLKDQRSWEVISLYNLDPFPCFTNDKTICVRQLLSCGRVSSTNGTCVVTSRFYNVRFFFLHDATALSGPRASSLSRVHEHAQTHKGLLWSSDQPDAEASIWQHMTSMPPAGFEPAIPAREP